MNWNDFLLKLKALRAEGGKFGFNAGVITRLIYAGAFNSMLTGMDEYTKLPAHERCLRMTTEAVKAMKSNAKLPKASKTEPIGIEDIRNDAGLVLWRHTVNPLFQFNLSNLYKAHLNATMGFQPTKTGDTRMIPMSLALPNKPVCDLYARWEDVYNGVASMSQYKSGVKTASVMGIITKVDKFVMKTGRVALKVLFFDGFREYDIKLWPEKDKEVYNQAKAAYLKPCAVGLLLIKPDVYMGTKTGNLIHFYEMSL